jgi:hypothetical protein
VRLEAFAKGFIGCFSIEGSMGSIEVLEVFPLTELGLEIHVALAGQELVKFLLVGAVRTLDLAVQPLCSALDVSVTDALIFDVPMELCLEFMAVVSSAFPDPERESIDDVIDEVYRVCLCVFVADLKGPETRSAWDSAPALPSLTPSSIAVDARSNAAAAEFVRGKIRALVKDPVTAELMMPKYPIALKRPPLGNLFYEALIFPMSGWSMSASILRVRRPRRASARRCRNMSLVSSFLPSALMRSLGRSPIRMCAAVAANCSAQMGGRSAHATRGYGRRIPEHVHGDGPANAFCKRAARCGCDRRLDWQGHYQDAGGRI